MVIIFTHNCTWIDRYSWLLQICFELESILKNYAFTTDHTDFLEQLDYLDHVTAAYKALLYWPCQNISYFKFYVIAQIWLYYIVKVCFCNEKFHVE